MSRSSQSGQKSPDTLYCPNCAREVNDPLTCGDCSAVICRVCGTPLESSAAWELDKYQAAKRNPKACRSLPLVAEHLQ